MIEMYNALNFITMLLFIQKISRFNLGVAFLKSVSIVQFFFYVGPTLLLTRYNLGRVVRKPAFCICENKDADQLCGNLEADQRRCFRYIDSTIPILLKYEISSL